MIHRLQIDVVDSGGNEADRGGETNWNAYSKFLTRLVDDNVEWSMAVSQLGEIYQYGTCCGIQCACSSADSVHVDSAFTASDVRAVLLSGVAIQKEIS